MVVKEFSTADWQAVFNYEKYGILVGTNSLGGFFGFVDQLATGLQERGSGRLARKVIEGAVFINEYLDGDDAIHALFSYQLFINTLPGLEDDPQLGSSYNVIINVISALLVNKLGGVA